MAADFQTAVRSLLVPTAPGCDAEIEARVRSELLGLGIPEDDHGRWISAEQRAWLTSRRPSDALKRLVRLAIFDAAQAVPSYSVPPATIAANGLQDAVGVLSTTYFELFDKLVSEHLLGDQIARQLLSHSGVILRLRLLDRMSASEIARWISAADTRQPTSWKSIRTILADLGCVAEIDAAQLTACFDADSEAEADIFGDQTVSECIASISEIAADLGIVGDFENWLTALTGPGNHPPYLVILHYQLTIQAFFDHALSYLYEFTPRGAAALSLIEKYKDAGALHVEGNPFLNNAKAVERADFNWVLAKKDNKSSVRALSALLLTLESVGPALKSEMSVAIRRLLCRLLRLKSEEGDDLEMELPNFTAESFGRLVRNAAQGNSETTGILEQRLTEILAISRHGPEWTSRGIGDSVFAANTFRKKFGDCEFDLPVRPNPQVVAYEAHGGRLTGHYINDHLYTFGRVLEKRAEQMALIADIEAWEMSVTFVAHDLEAALPHTQERLVRAADGTEVRLTINLATYRDLAEELAAAPLDLAERVLSGMNNRLVHPKIREKVLALLD